MVAMERSRSSGARSSGAGPSGAGPSGAGSAGVGHLTDGAALQVNKETVAALLSHDRGWRESAVTVPGGQAGFRMARVTPGISITRSDCTLAAPFRSVVEHEGEVCLLAIGLRGRSMFAYDAGRSDHLVEAGDIWLFRTSDARVIRHTPAHPHVSMVALKLDAARLDPVIDGLRPYWRDRGTHAVRLAHGRDARGPLQDLLGNPLDSALDRLRAESLTLGLAADWLSPLPTTRARADTGLSPADRKAVARVAERVTADLTMPPSLEDLAALAGMTHVRLNRCFKQAYGDTVFAWLRAYRLDVAARLLRAGDVTVTEVAFQCGFSSSSHLAAAFRQAFGCAPTDYSRSG